MRKLTSPPAVSLTRHAIQKAQCNSCEQLVMQTVSWKFALVTAWEAWSSTGFMNINKYKAKGFIIYKSRASDWPKVICFSSSFYILTCSMWKTPVQGSNWSCTFCLCHCSGSTRSELHLWPTAQLAAMQMLNPLSQATDGNLHPHRDNIGSLTRWASRGTPEWYLLRIRHNNIFLVKISVSRLEKLNFIYL